MDQTYKTPTKPTNFFNSYDELVIGGYSGFITVAIEASVITNIVAVLGGKDVIYKLLESFTELSAITHIEALLEYIANALAKLTKQNPKDSTTSNDTQATTNGDASEPLATQRNYVMASARGLENVPREAEQNPNKEKTTDKSSAATDTDVVVIGERRATC